MAEQVRIKNGPNELTVSRKAFETVYRAKGFHLVSGELKAAAELAESNESSTLAAPATDAVDGNVAHGELTEAGAPLTGASSTVAAPASISIPPAAPATEKAKVTTPKPKASSGSKAKAASKGSTKGAGKAKA